MKKSLFALAALGAFAGVASAQTNVSIYGVVDVGIVYENAATSRWFLDGSEFNRNFSRLGFKGSEDLGGGLSAFFTLENGFDSSNSALDQQSATMNSPAANRLFGRQAFVGLKGGFGSVQFGRVYTPLFSAVDSIDPFGTGTVAASNNIFDTARVRMDNTVMYSLDAAGFTGSLAYSFGEQTTGISASAAYGARLGYANGPINVQLAYHDANNTTNTGDYKVAFMGGTYNFGVAKIHAAYEKTDADAGIYGSVARTALDSNTYLLGASAPIGAGTLMASWIRNDNKLLNVDTDQYGIGYAHQLSKRTAVYTTYARTKIDRAADDIDRFQVGYQHKF